MSNTTRLSTKGQVVLPKSLRSAHRWRAGTEFVVREYDGGILLMPKVGSKSLTWNSVLGCLPYSGRRKSIREMDAGVAVEARKHR